jgi:hypothetical protein
MKKLFILFIAAAMVATVTVPAMADAEWNFYGSARFATFRIDDDPDTTGVDADKDTQWEQQGNSRIGARVKFNDEIGGRFEMSDSFGKRLLYGTYNFGGGELLIGQSYTPSTYFYSNSVYDGDGDLLGVGQFYEGRQQMIQLKFPFGLKIALISPNVEDYEAVEEVTFTPFAAPNDEVEVVSAEAVNYDVDTTIPKVEVSFGFKTDMFFVDVFGGWQEIELESDEVGVRDADVTSIVYGGGLGGNFGPVFFKLGAHAGENLGDYGAYNPHDVGDGALVTPSTGKTEDNDTLGYLAVFGIKAGDAATIEVGYGFHEVDSNVAGSQEDETCQYYANATINITDGFFIVPEIGKIDRKEDATKGAGNDEGDIVYFGAKWQINF